MSLKQANAVKGVNMRNKRETDISRYTDKSADTGIITEKSESG